MRHADDDLSAAESLLYQQSALGHMADYSQAQPIDVNDGASWGPERTVRAEKLSALLTGEVAGLTVHWRGVRVRGARITGALDLTNAVLTYPMELTDCFIERQIMLVETESRRIVLAGSHVAGLDATGAQIRGGLHFSHGFISLGPVFLAHATVAGELICNGGQFLNAPYSILADKANIAGGISLSVTGVADTKQRFQSVGAVRLWDAKVGGDMDCRGGQFGVDQASISLNASGAEVDGTAYLGVTEVAGQAHAFSAAGLVRLIDARVGGDLDCDGGQFGKEPASTSLEASRVQVGGTAYLGVMEVAGQAHAFSAAGQVRLIDARIGVDLACNGGQFGKDPASTSLDATRVQVAGTAYLGVTEVAGQVHAFSAAGQVWLATAKVGGDLDCRGGQFRQEKETSLNADRISVTRTLRLGTIKQADHAYQFTAAGPVSLIQATVGGDLDCDGGQFGKEPASTSLDATRVQVAGTAYLGVTEVAGQVHAFSAAGQVRLATAKVGGDLDCRGGQFRQEKETSLNADRISVTRTLRLGTIKQADHAYQFTAAGPVSLIQATVGGDLDCDGGQFGKEPASTSLDATRVQVAGTAYLGVTEVAGQVHAFSAAGLVGLVGARVGGDLDCDGGQFGKDPASTSLEVDAAEVVGDAYLGVTEVAGQAHAFSAAGLVRLIDARVRGDLNCDGGQFGKEPASTSLDATRVQVGGTAYLGVMEAAGQAHAFSAAGQVDLTGVTVAGDLNCDGGQFGKEPASTSLDATRVQVAGTAYLGVTEVAGQVHAFSAAGQVRLVTAKVGGDLDCRGGQFRQEKETSLNADRISVTRTLRLGTIKQADHAYQFTAAGPFRLSRPPWVATSTVTVVTSAINTAHLMQTG